MDVRTVPTSRRWSGAPGARRSASRRCRHTNGFAYVLLQLGDLGGTRQRRCARDRSRARPCACSRLRRRESGLRAARGGTIPGGRSGVSPSPRRLRSGSAGLRGVCSAGTRQCAGRSGPPRRGAGVLAAAGASWVKSKGHRTPERSRSPTRGEAARRWIGRYADAAGCSRKRRSARAQSHHKDLQIRRTLRALVEYTRRTSWRAEEYRVTLAASEAQIAQLASADCASAGSVR